MTPTEAAAWVRSLTYKPGWTFNAWVQSWHYRGSIFVVINARLPDVEQHTDLRIAREIGEFSFKTERHLSEAVRTLVNGIEQHEIDEWLRHDGKPVRNPHPEEVLAEAIKSEFTPLEFKLAYNMTPAIDAAVRESQVDFTKLIQQAFTEQEMKKRD